MHTGLYWTVTISKAVMLLRKKSALSQAAFAELTGTSVETISRWENGHRSPNIETMKKLAALAESNNQPELRDVFESKWKKRIANRVRNLPSKGTQRRVSLDDLKFNAAVARYLAEDLENTLRRIGREFPDAENRYQWLVMSLRNAIHYLGRLHEETEMHIDENYGFDRAEEDKRLLRRPSKSTYGLQPNITKKGKNQ